MCCSHHVGRKFYDQVTDCKKKCNGLINGIDWTLTQKKGEKGFDETNKSNTAKSSNTKDSKTPAQKDSKKTNKARKDSKKTNKGKDGKNTNKGKDNKKTGKNKNKKTNPDALLEKLAKHD